MKTALITQPRTAYTIRFGDCDPFGHLNNARYLDYIINAREDHLRQFYDLDLQTYYKKGTGWVITSHEIQYLKPARFNEKVVIQSALIDYGPGHLMVEGILFDETGETPKAVLWTQFAFINLQTGKRDTHPQEFLDFASEIIHEAVETGKGLKVRVTNILAGKIE